MDITEFRRNITNQRHPWEITRAKIIQKFIQKYHSHCLHILDIGSGDAFILDFLYSKKLATKYTAVDTAYTKEIVEFITDNKKHHIKYLDQLPASLEPKADCILLLDVLEHCENDDKVLKQLTSNHIAKSTVCFITVPAFQNLFSEHDKLLQHYRRYTIKTLNILCKQNKLQVISKGYFFTSLLLIRCIQLFLEKLGFRKPKKSIDNWKGGHIISKLVVSFLWFDFLVGRFFSKIRIPIPGLSAYCICRTLPS